MALEYTLEIEKNQNSRYLEQLLYRNPEFQQGPDGIVASNMQVHIGQPHALQVETIKEEFGFKPTASVNFRLNKAAEPVATRKAFLAGVWPCWIAMSVTQFSCLMENQLFFSCKVANFC